MFKNLFDKVDNYWFCIIITAILCFGYAITNATIGVDDERMHLLTSMKSILIDARLGNILTAKIIPTQEFLPFWREFLSVLLMVTGITVHLNNFIKYTENIFSEKKQQIIFSCIALSFPYLAFHFIFMNTCLEHGLVFLFSGIAVNYLFKYFENQKKTYLILVILFLYTALSLYELGLVFFTISSLFIIFINLINKNSYNIKEYIHNLFIIGATIITSLIINEVLLITLKRLYSIDYSKLNDYSMYDFSSVSNFFISLNNILIHFLKNFTETLKYNTGSVTVLICTCIFLILITYFSFKKRNILIFITGIMITILPYIFLFLTGAYDYYFRIYSGLSFFNAFSLVLLYSLIKDKKIISNIFLYGIVLIILFQSKEMNQIFYTEHLKYENDKQFSANLMYDLEKLSLNEKPIAFAGVRNNPSLKNTYWIDAGEVNVSIFNWDRYDNAKEEIWGRRGAEFLKSLGYNVVSIKEAGLLGEQSSIRKICNDYKNEVTNMNIYPKDNSIKDMGEYVLIKIGPSKWDTPDIYNN